jgi:Ca2+-binding RTX toxin-like protein
MSIRTRTRRLHLENLEGRALMAGSVSVAAGWLVITGANGQNDQAVVTDTNPAFAGSQVLVSFNGQLSAFAKPLITQGVKFWGFGGNDSFTTNLARPVRAYGGDGNDTLNGGPANDQLYGQNGEDELNGNVGNDSMWGGLNDDTLTGGSGNDLVYGDQGNDYSEPGDGNDKFYGGLGNDTCLAGDGNDTLHGSDGNDALYGANDNDKIYGEGGLDDLNGGSGNDSMYGGGDADDLVGSSGNDSMYGNDGNDSLDGGTGNDSLRGGNQNDDLHGGDGNDWMTGQTGHDVLYGDDGNDLMYGYTGNDTLVGGDGNDTLSGWDGNDRLYGREGTDVLYGQAGMDGLMGGNGLDVVNGGSGSDRYLTIGDQSEIVSMSGGDATIHFGGPQLWTYPEIERIDAGLARLHQRTGNTVLLKDPDGAVPADPKVPRLFIERDAVSANGYSGETHGDTITMYNAGFTSANWTESVIVHEVAHMWDSPDENSYTLGGQNVVTHFRSLSGWRDDLGEGAAGDTQVAGGHTYVKALSGEWWYRQDALFVSSYARKAPTEDFCETVAAVVMGNDFAGSGEDPLAAVAKRAWINQWLNVV